MLIFLIVLISFGAIDIDANQWSKNYSLPGDQNILTSINRKNIFNKSSRELNEQSAKGLSHALFYPVATTRFLLSFDTLKTVFEPNSKVGEKKYTQIARKVLERKFNVTSYVDLFNQVGMHNYPHSIEQNYNIPYIPKEKKSLPMGTTVINRYGASGLTFSCAGCHSSNLFGVKVLGLTNRFPRANEAFSLLKKASPLLNPHIYKELVNPNDGDFKIYSETAQALKFIGAKKPKTLGLDTSLAHTALSLFKRADDEYASLIPQNAIESSNPLSYIPADSKPGVWWNLKYKTRWLLDGSLVSGNPIYTNILWNEIGRGANLRDLENWLDQNQSIVNDLTTAVFNLDAPKYSDFFNTRKLDLDSAKRGGEIFHKSCHRCHGIYEKAWDLKEAYTFSTEEQLITTKVHYFKKTPVVDVETDPYRHQGMKHFYKRLNKLKLSKKNDIKIEPQRGYVPPPLEGIWARWPYMHNNSIPSLCELLTVESKRKPFYYAVPPKNQESDFDQECNGYPKVSQLKPEQKREKFQYLTKKKGLSNQGHSKGILEDFEGNEYYSKQEKIDLVNFLKTL